MNASPSQEGKLPPVIIIIVVYQRHNDPQAMLTSLIDCPINGIECSVVELAKLGHQAQRIANANAQCLAADSSCSHSVQHIHSLSDSASRRIAGIQRCIERLTFWRMDVLVKPKPINVGAAGCPADSIDHQLCTIPIDIRVPRCPCLQWGKSVLENFRCDLMCRENGFETVIQNTLLWLQNRRRGIVGKTLGKGAHDQLKDHTFNKYFHNCHLEARRSGTSWQIDSMKLCVNTCGYDLPQVFSPPSPLKLWRARPQRRALEGSRLHA